VFLYHIDPICFLPLVTHLHALIWITYTLYTYHECHTSLPSYMMLSLACVFVRVFGLPSLVVWIGKVWNGGDGWIPLGDVDWHAQIC
jgi:hypothetical protein